MGDILGKHATEFLFTIERHSERPPHQSCESKYVYSDECVIADPERLQPEYHHKANVGEAV